MKCQEKKTTGKRTAGTEPWIAQGKGVLIGLVSMVIILAVCAGLIAGGVIPEKGMDICVVAAAGVGGVLTEISAACMRGKGGGISGMLGGLLTALVCLVSGFLLYGNVDMVRCAVVGIMMMVAGGGAGYACAGKKKRRR